MPLVRTHDVPGGDTVTQFLCENGYRVPVFTRTEDEIKAIFDNIPNIRCRDDDIFLNSYAKTGSNWLFEILTMILTGKPEYCPDTKQSQMLECLTADQIESQPSPRILNTHVKVNYIPKEAREKKLKCILLARNPKDVVVSFYNHSRGIHPYEYNGKFDNYLQLFMRGEVDYGSYPDYMYEWQQYIRANPDWPIHVMYYEDLKENCLEELQRMCQYLEVDVSTELLTDVVAACSIDKLRQNKESKLNARTKALFHQLSSEGINIMFRKGQIGDWKNWFKVSQSETFDDWWAAQTRDLDMFTFRYTSSDE